MKLSSKGLSLIKEFEGLELEAYLCAAGVPTIGYGSTANVVLNTTITEAEAEELLRQDVATFEECVNDFVDVDLTQSEFDALVCFSFNVGCNAFMNSTLLRLINQGNKEAAAQQFSRWNRAGKKVLAGLTRRREAEKQLFMA